LVFQIISLDVTTFRPLKLGLKQAVLVWHWQNSYTLSNKELLAPVQD